MPIDAQLELTLVFSEDLGTELYTKIVGLIKSYSGEKFQRGVFSTNRMFLNFASNEEMSPFVASLVKRLSLACQEYRIGIRDYYVPYYELSFDCDHVGKLKIPYTEAVICNGKTCKIVFKDIERDFLRGGAVSRVIYLIQSKTRDKLWKTVYKSEPEAKGNINPYEEVEKSNLARKGLAKNEYFYLPRGAKEISRLKNIFLNSLKEDFKLEEFLPVSHTTFSLAETEGLIESVPQELFEYVFCETENASEAFESYFINGSVRSVNARLKGFIFDEIPINLYKAMEKTEIKDPAYLYCQKGPEVFITFFENENYESATQKISEAIRSIIDSLGLNYRIISRSVNGEIIRFEAYLPYSKSWAIIAELAFSESAYTKPFSIEGKSGQININLENVLLAQVAQGVVSLKPKEMEIMKEELPREDKKDFAESELLE